MPTPADHVAVAAIGAKLRVRWRLDEQSLPGELVPINNAWECRSRGRYLEGAPPMPTARGAAVATVVEQIRRRSAERRSTPGQPLVALSASVPHRALPTNEAFDLTTQKGRPSAP